MNKNENKLLEIIEIHTKWIKENRKEIKELKKVLKQLKGNNNEKISKCTKDY